jgi:hypothetical protein
VDRAMTRTTGALHKARETLRALEAVEIAGVSLAYNSNPAAKWWHALGDKPLLPISTYFVDYKFTPVGPSAHLLRAASILLPYFSAKDELDAFMQAKQALDSKVKAQKQKVRLLQLSGQNIARAERAAKERETRWLREKRIPSRG